MYRTLPFCLLLIISLECLAQNPTSGSNPDPSKAPAAAITLEQAIQLAKSNAPQFRQALTESGLAREDKVQARADLLPGVSYTTGAIYTQPNGTPSGIYVAANSVHEYISQGVVHEALSVTSVADYRKAHFLEALGRAKAEVALRGLVSTVVQDFYGVIAFDRKAVNAQAAADEAKHFLGLSQQLEHGGEVAHSDVIKAQLQANDRERDLQEARLADEKARLALAVLIFPTFTRDYNLLDDLQQFPAIPDLPRVQELAARNNADVAAAIASMKAADQEVTSAIGGHLPSLNFNYFYGIDATHYATRTDGVSNLGYQVSASLDLPIFNWGATQSKVRQAQLRRDQANVELKSAQREALANLQGFYDEAKVALGQLDILRQSAELSVESLKLTNLRYRSGEATALEVVDAQNTAVQARNNYDDGAVRYRVALANLQTLTGSF